MDAKTLGVTHRSVADAWECDQMGHMNARFIGHRFDEAEREAMRAIGATPTLPMHETLTFSHEARAGSVLRIETCLAGIDPLTIRHDLLAENSEGPVASLETRYGVTSASIVPGEGEWLECGRTFTRSEECRRGMLGRNGLLRLFNHAGGHLGLDRLRTRTPDGSLLIGSAMVGCTMQRLASIGPDEPVRVESRFGRRGKRSIRVLHRVRDAVRGTLLAEADVATVFFDLTTRRAVPLPTEAHPTTTTGT